MAICVREDETGAEYNFIAVSKVSRNRKNTYRDYHLTRHACYIIAESADGRKDEVAWAKIYFALTTERYELLAQTEEDRLRVEQRQKNLLQNAELAMKARAAGAMTPQQFARFFNEGYQGLYNGETAEDIRIRKGYRPGQTSWIGWVASRARPTPCAGRWRCII